MVDVKTIKPGDKVVIDCCETDDDFIKHTIGYALYARNPDRVYDVACPPIRDGNHCVFIEFRESNLPNGEFSFPARFLFPAKETIKCTCDSFRVLMVSGCRCGAFQREREAAR